MGRLLMGCGIISCCVALLISCPVNMQPPMKVIEPMQNSDILWQVEKKIGQAGFIRDPAVKPSGEIVLTRKKVYEIFPGDQVIVRQTAVGDIQIGRHYICYRLLDAPVIDDRYPVKGRHHMLTGVVEIVSDWKGLFEARVVDSYRGIGASDLLMPVDDNKPEFTIYQGTIGVTGHILGSEDRTLTFATNDIVLLDRGTHQGIEKGQIYGVFSQQDAHRRDLYVKDDLYLNVGSLIILRAEAETSTALIIKSEQEMYPGIFFMSELEDPSMLWKKASEE
jgi:hypothetical protein